MTEQFIGMKISLTSRAQLRYRGTVHSIDSTQGTMTLQNVSSMGTEDRPAAQFIPPMLDRVHPVVVFTVNDILDLAIEPTAPPASQTLPDDPAIRQSNQMVAAPPPHQQQPPAQQQYSQPPPHVQARPPPPPPPPHQVAYTSPPPPHQGSYNQAPLSTIEKIEQTVGEIRNHGGPSQPSYQSQPRQGGGGGGFRGGRGRGSFPGGPGQGHRLGGPGPAPPVIPAEEYDFEQMNRKFEEMRTREQKSGGQGQAEVVLSSSKGGVDSQTTEEDSDDDSDEEVVMGKKGPTTGSGLQGDEQEQVAPVYNKSKSFFDSVSSDVSVNTRQGGGGRGGRGGAPGAFDGAGRGGGGGGGGGGFKWQRSQERMTNLNTFGEAGGNNNHHNGGGRGRGGFPRGRGRGGGGGYRGSAPGYAPQQQQQQTPF